MQKKEIYITQIQDSIYCYICAVCSHKEYCNPGDKEYKDCIQCLEERKAA
jgi:hypothetical protein